VRSSKRALLPNAKSTERSSICST